MSDHGVHITLPADRFYWAVIDIGSLPPRHRRDARSLGFLFENTLPVPIEQVHAAYQPLGNHRAIGCAIPTAELEVLTTSNPGMLTLGPHAMPPFASNSDDEVEKLNLLTGPFEPAILRKSRRRLMILVITAILGLDILVALGFERRSASMRDQAAAIRSMRRTIIADALGDVHGANPSASQPPELRFLAQLRTLRQTRRASQSEVDAGVTGQAPIDVTPALATLAQFWPPDLHIQVDSISITPTSLTLRASAPASSAVQSLADALRLDDGWQSNQPQIQAASAGTVNATLQWKRELDQPDLRPERRQP